FSEQLAAWATSDRGVPGGTVTSSGSTAGSTGRSPKPKVPRLCATTAAAKILGTYRVVSQGMAPSVRDSDQKSLVLYRRSTEASPTYPMLKPASASSQLPKRRWRSLNISAAASVAIDASSR